MISLLALTVTSYVTIFYDGWSMRGCNSSTCRVDEYVYSTPAPCVEDLDIARRNYPTLAFSCVHVLRSRRVDTTP